MKRIGLILITLGIVSFALLANRVRRIPLTRAVNTNQENKPTASPDFTLKDLEDHDVSLTQFKGKVVLVNFWATWCGPCRIEIPWLVELQDKYAARGFTVLGVAMDEEGKVAVAPFVQKERFKVRGTPQSMAEAVAEMIEPYYDWEEEFLKDEFSAGVERALSDLPADYRMAVVLADVEEFSYEEIARIMECPIGTVMSRLNRARRMLVRLILAQSEKGIAEKAAPTPQQTTWRKL